MRMISCEPADTAVPLNTNLDFEPMTHVAVDRSPLPPREAQKFKSAPDYRQRQNVHRPQTGPAPDLGPPRLWETCAIPA